MWAVATGREFDSVPEESSRLTDYQEAMWTGVGPMIRQTMGQEAGGRYSPRDGEFGPALTPSRLSWTLWRARACSWLLLAGLSALVALLALSALMVRQYGRLLP